MGWRDWAMFVAICAGARGLHWLLDVTWHDWDGTAVLIVAAMCTIVNAIRKDVQ